MKKVGQDEILKIDITPFIKSLKEDTEKNLSIYGFNENIHKIENSFYETLAANSDPIKNTNIELEKLDISLQNFLKEDNKTDHVFVLLGSSGSGKSTILQIEYLKALRNWKKGKPIPIFLNLNKVEDLKLRWKWINEQLFW